MVSFATPDALNAFTGSTFDTARAQQVLDQATADIQEETNQYLFPKTDDVAICNPSNRGVVLLPQIAVTAVSLVEYLDEDDVWQTLDTKFYRWGRGRVYLVKRPDYWPWQDGTIRITYSHGYSPIPAGLASVCIRLASRILANPFDVQKQVTGGIQVQFSGARGTGGFTESEIVTLGRYSLVEVS